MASRLKEHPTSKLPNLKEPKEVMDVKPADSWMTPIIRYLEHDKLLADKNEARRLRAKVVRFTIYLGQLLRKSFSGPYLKCTSLEEAKYVLTELQESEYENYAGGHSLARWVITAGYYWPTIRTNSKSYVKKCNSCQRFAHVSHLLPERLKSTLTPWPFMKCGMDIVGKLPTASEQRVFILAVTDYFTKWIEAETLA
ncbi:uncharacterized protein LOC116142666 [Pistacia vera]|uniref:uncharacterized protein LOC116142666 n=1 Tax=Pistacia vera TaxID=55513 RepID=UPI0012638DE6|nr:uncharacterized protein LOC116142666 [Pistacia vera]